MPKDGQGSANPYCVVSAGTWMRDVVVFFAFTAGWSDGTFSFSGLREREREVSTLCPYCNRYRLQLDYDGQRKRTKVKTKDLDPNWNEKVSIRSSSPLSFDRHIQTVIRQNSDLDP
jgi:hypothetical protein